MADVQKTHTARVEDRATEKGEVSVSNADAMSAAAVMTAIAKAALPDVSPMSAPKTPPVLIAAVSSSDLVHTDAKEAASSAKTSTNHCSFLQTPSAEAPVQIATASAPDLVHEDAKEAVNSTANLDESLPDLSQALAPPNAKETGSSNEASDECSVGEVCIDQYLWSLYQRAPKQDAVRVVERRNVIVKMDGKPRTVVKEFTKLVEEDFTWKDPKAAEKASLSLMEYVIGGMDPSFKLKLYCALHAMDDAGLSPGITSAFRDDYRQSLASGLKAATDRSYHGGSFRGGYGHGLAADLVSVKGETRAERFVSSGNYGNGLTRTERSLELGDRILIRTAHVAPIDGKGYTDHRRVANSQHARSEIKKRTLLAIRDDHSNSRPAKTARSSNF